MIAKLVIQYRAYIPGYFLNPLSLIGKVACVHNSGSVSLFWLPEHQIRLEKKKKNQESLRLQTYRFSSTRNNWHNLHKTGYKWHSEPVEN